MTLHCGERIGQRIYRVVRARHAAVPATVHGGQAEIGVGFLRNLNAEAFNAPISENRPAACIAIKGIFGVNKVTPFGCRAPCTVADRLFIAGKQHDDIARGFKLFSAQILQGKDDTGQGRLIVV